MTLGPDGGVGARLRSLRRDRNLTQEDVASRAGISDTYVSKIERGGNTVPLSTLRRLAEALDAAPEELAGGPVDTDDGAAESARGHGEILAAATELFSTKGYSRVSIRELATQAGCSTANLYHHFSSKYDIFVALIEGAMDRHQAGLDEACELYDDPAHQLRHALRNHLLLNMTRPEFGLVTHDFHPMEGRDLARFIAERDTYERGVRAVVQRGVDQGVLAAADPAVATRTMLDALNSVHHWFRPDAPLSAEQVADRIVDFFMTGFLARPPADGGGDP